MVLSQKLHEAFKGTVERITGPAPSPPSKRMVCSASVSSFSQATISSPNALPGPVPCLRRAASIAEKYDAAGGEVLLDDENNDGWLATHGKPKETKADEDNLPSMETLEISEGKTIQSISSYFGGDNKDDIPDMAEYEDQDNITENDPATLQTTYLVAREPDEENILRTRTYDVSITYDKYYPTPRVWLTSYDEV